MKTLVFILLVFLSSCNLMKTQVCETYEGNNKHAKEYKISKGKLKPKH